MSIIDSILSLYPDAVSPYDFIVEDRGAGQFVSMWNISGPLPEGVHMGQTAIQEWADGGQNILDRLRTIMKDANDLSALFEDNKSIYAAILATAPGEIVAGTTYTREQLVFMGALFQDTRLYMAGAVTGSPPHGLDDPPTRRAVVMAR